MNSARSAVAMPCAWAAIGRATVARARSLRGASGASESLRVRFQSRSQTCLADIEVFPADVPDRREKEFRRGVKKCARALPGGRDALQSYSVTLQRAAFQAPQRRARGLQIEARLQIGHA